MVAFNLLSRFFKFRIANAHCDVPCGIYDPHSAQVAAHTVLRMVDLIESADKSDVHKITRYTLVKEQHAELCKKELRVLWGDYFKPAHLEKYPELHDLFWEAMKAASKARQTTSRENATKLVDITNKIAEIFWETKGIDTTTITPYTTNYPLVIPR